MHRITTLPRTQINAWQCNEISSRQLNVPQAAGSLRGCTGQLLSSENTRRKTQSWLYGDRLKAGGQEKRIPNSNRESTGRASEPVLFLQRMQGIRHFGVPNNCLINATRPCFGFNKTGRSANSEGCTIDDRLNHLLCSRLA